VLFERGNQAEPIRLRRRFSAARDGLSVRYPADWQVTTHNETFVDNPELCFTLRPSAGKYARSVAVKLVEYLPPLLDKRDLARDPITREPGYSYRPAHFRLSMLQPPDNDWTRGDTLDFQDHGRVFYVGVDLPHSANGSTKRTVEAVLDSIKVGAGRCRPTSGVGS